MAIETTTKKGMKVPRPRGVPILGNLFSIDVNSPICSILELVQRPEFRDAIAFDFAGQRVIFVNTAALLNELCDESRFKKAVHSGIEKMRQAVGDGLFTAYNEEENWGIAHRVLMPIFGPMKIREMFPQMKDIASQLALKWARHGDTAEILVADDFTRLTLDTIALCTMGFRFNSFYAGEKLHPFVGSMLAALHEADIQSGYPDSINAIRFSASKNMKKHTNVMRSISESIIEKRRAQPVAAPDLLNTMLMGKDPKTGKGMSDKSIIDNMVTFLIAGHETTSGLLSFAFYYMITNPSTLEKARQEIDEVAGTNALTTEHLSKLPYINAVLRETLRLQPTAPAFAVYSDKDEIIGGKYLIRAGQHIMGFLHGVHRDKEAWGEDAEEFKPERMLDENLPKIPQNAWKPFGNGMRGCIGRAFAWQEALLVVSMVLQHFTLEMADPTYKLKIKETLTLKPEGFYIRAKIRHYEDATELAKAIDHGSSPVLKTSSSLTSVATSRTQGDSKPITFLYGSNTGTCEALAHHLAKDAATKGFSATIAPVDSATRKLPTDQPVVILTASYDGRPADNAAQFVEWLENLNTSPSPLEGVQYAIFGCGHRDWTTTFHHVPKIVDTLLSQAGATRIAPLGTADAAVSDLFSDLETWSSEQLWPALGYARDDGELVRSLLKVDVQRPRRVEMHEGLIEALVTGSRSLTASDALVRKQHVELELPAGTRYEAGDHLTVLPVNPWATVKRALARFHLSRDSMITYASGENITGISQEGTVVSAADILSCHVELAQPATPRDTRVLAAASTNPKTREALERLATESYESEIRDTRTSILDLLERFPDVDLPFGTFLSLVPSLRLRTYSISSAPPTSQTSSPNKSATVPSSLTFSILDQPARSNSASRFQGVASTYLAELTRGDVVYVGIKKARDAFRVPSDKIPIVMIAAGAGYAPFRGFLQEISARRSVSDGAKAETLLFLGCRGTEDDIYREELDKAEETDVVGVVRAYSRSSDGLGVENVVGGHVQDALKARRAQLVELWKKGAKFFVCGNSKMASDVRKIIREVAVEAEAEKVTGDGEEAAWFAQFEPSRYVAEIFA
ncbi:cytochrome P450 [Hypoxylon trugodes]|uniref:cytochrome P450 n=1 Tax=Hypoxylon trugodes TaxID=326681 RepID=UPI00219D5D43|nr:cytochrome P450 [Hypoxylon trugodes]KAI1391417.1 cytochrome P450 [Hypoxylon trugodes]